MLQRLHTQDKKTGLNLYRLRNKIHLNTQTIDAFQTKLHFLIKTCFSIKAFKPLCVNYDSSIT